MKPREKEAEKNKTGRLPEKRPHSLDRLTTVQLKFPEEGMEGRNKCLSKECLKMFESVGNCKLIDQEAQQTSRTKVINESNTKNHGDNGLMTLTVEQRKHMSNKL